MRSLRPGVADADLPLALLAVGFFLWMAFQTVQLVRDSELLVSINHNQDTPLQEASRLRQGTDALASETADLAAGGNAGAKLVVEEMARQNVAIRSSAASPSAAPANAAAAPAAPSGQSQK